MQNASVFLSAAQVATRPIQLAGIPRRVIRRPILCNFSVDAEVAAGTAFRVALCPFCTDKSLVHLYGDVTFLSHCVLNLLERLQGRRYHAATLGDHASNSRTRFTDRGARQCTRQGLERDTGE